MSKALVIGLGASGVACTQFLIKRGYEVIGTDTRETPPSLERLQTLPAFTFRRLSDAQASLDDVEFVVISPGISPYYSEVAPIISKAQSMQLPWFGEIELFARELEHLKNERQYEPIVLAITGTNGKTTTTVLTTKMAEASGKFAVAAGNIGPNAVTELDRYLEEGRLPDVWVLELSSFQLESTHTLAPTAAALLNITQDHLDWHGSMQAYMDAKAHIFQSEKTVRVLNRDDAGVMQYASAPRVATFGESAPEGENQWGLVKDDELFWLAYNEDDSIALSKRKVLPGELLQRLMPEEALKIRGRHNTMNALAALALIHAANLPLADAIRALSNYTGEAHRVQYALTVDGVDYIDDSKGTNVGATVAALEGLGATGKKMVVILGGDGKGQDFSPIAQSMALHARGAVLIGRDAPLIEKALAGATYPVQKAQTLPEAVQMCAQMAKTGDYVLLSPACASWDMFRDYAQRSEIFIESARALEKN